MILDDYYSILNIEYPSSKIEIKKAYKEQAKRYHPDVNPGVDAKERIQAINEAYKILGNSSYKAIYDKEYIKLYGSNSSTSDDTATTYSKFEFDDSKLKSIIIKVRNEISETQHIIKDEIAGIGYNILVGLIAIVFLFLLIQLVGILF